MEQALTNIFVEGWFYQLVALVSLTLLFAIVGLKDMGDDHPEGFYYLVLSIFFGIAHGALLITTPILSSISTTFGESIWIWLVFIFAPALITLFVLRGLFSMMMSKSREGMVKLFFGVTLIFFLHIVGYNWPVDTRGILTIIWLALFFKTEFSIAT